MANAIANAIGTQQQFATQPKTPYQKRLITPNAGAGVNIEADRGAMMLAQSLGVIGEGIFNESVAMDKRQKMIGEAEADRIFASASDDDKKKIQTIDLLGRTSNFDIIDNPYAVARIDELRGQYLNSVFKNEYENTVLPNQKLAENSQANIKQYEDYMNQRLQETELTVNNHTAFNKGFYGSRPVDVLQQDVKYRKKKQEELETERNTMLASKADTICANSYGKPADELKKELEELQNDEALTHVPLDQRIKILNSMGKTLADNGDPAQIDALGNLVAYTSMDTGKPVYIKDVLPIETYKQLAYNKNVYLNEQQSHDLLQKWSQLPSGAIYEAVMQEKAKNPQLVKALMPKVDNLINAKKKEEEAQAKLRLTQQLGAQTKLMNNKIMSARLKGWLDGKDMLADGNLVTSIKGYDGKNVSEEELNYLARQTISQWDEEVKAGRMTADELAHNKLMLFDFAPMQRFKSLTKQQNEHMLSALSVDALKTDENGKLQLPSNLEGMLNMYSLDRSRFSTIFGDAQASKLNILSDFIDTYGTEAGVSKYAEFNANRRNTEYAGQIKYTVEDNMRTKIIKLNVTDLMGDKSDVPITANPETFDLFYNVMSLQMYTGKNENEARNEAIAELSDKYVSYNNTLIPKAFFYYIQSPQQTRTAQAYLDKLGEDNLRFVFVAGKLLTYDTKKNTLVHSWNNREFAKAVGKWVKDNAYEPKAPTVDEVYNDGMSKQDNEAYNASNPDAEALSKAMKQTGRMRSLIE